MGFSRPYICPQEAATSPILLLATLLVMFDPPKVRKGQKTKLLWGFFRSEFASFCLFWHLNRPRPAAQWVRPNFFGPEGGQTIPPHHSIAKYLKNLKLISRTGTFILRHCVKPWKYYTTYSCPSLNQKLFRILWWSIFISNIFLKVTS